MRKECRHSCRRDGKHFSRVLNYLRDGALVLPASDQECQELRTEAEFYNLTGLAGLVDARMEAAERRRQQAERAAAEPTAAEDAAVRQIAAKLATPSPIYDLEDCNQRLTTVRRQIASLYRAIGAISLPPETRLQMLLQMHPIEFKLAELELSSRRMLR